MRSACNRAKPFPEADGLGGGMALLELRSIAKHFGAIEALDCINSTPVVFRIEKL